MNEWNHQKENAYHAFAQKNYQAASDEFKSILDQHGDSMGDKTYHLLSGDYATALLFLGKHQEAIQIFNQNLEYFQSSNDTHQTGLINGNLGTAYQIVHRYKDAEKAFVKATESINREMAPEEYFLSMKSLALVRMRTGQFKQAVWTYLKAIECKPNPSIFDKLLLSMLRFAFHLK